MKNFFKCYDSRSRRTKRKIEKGNRGEREHFHLLISTDDFLMSHQCSLSFSSFIDTGTSFWKRVFVKKSNANFGNPSKNSLILAHLLTCKHALGVLIIRGASSTEEISPDIKRTFHGALSEEIRKLFSKHASLIRGFEHRAEYPGPKSQTEKFPAC